MIFIKETTYNIIKIACIKSIIFASNFLLRVSNISSVRRKYNCQNSRLFFFILVAVEIGAFALKEEKLDEVVDAIISNA